MGGSFRQTLLFIVRFLLNTSFEETVFTICSFYLIPYMMCHRNVLNDRLKERMDGCVDELVTGWTNTIQTEIIDTIYIGSHFRYHG